jgi:diguanylate cyclase (GGDEF)-like protein
LLPEMLQVEYATTLAQKVLQAFREPFAFDGHELHITTSIGIAIFPDDDGDADTLIKNADIAMYRAKNKGRDSFQRYTPA